AGEGGIHIGAHVHLGCFCSLLGKGAITFEDFTGMSPRSSVFSSTDDFTGMHMSSPTIPDKYRKVTSGPVTFRKHAAVAACCLILPNVTMESNSSLGAMSLLKEDTEPGYMYFGRPAKKLMKRETRILELEKQFLQERDALMGGQDDD
ncbi:MAG: acyltransferase, partial [Candidatus Sumerlaeota bacterium]